MQHNSVFVVRKSFSRRALKKKASLKRGGPKRKTTPRTSLSLCGLHGSQGELEGKRFNRRYSKKAREGKQVETPKERGIL